MRYIDCEVNDEYVIGSGVVIGASGSHNDVGLRLKFGDMWVGLNIYATFTDANGEGSAVVMLMPSMLDDGEEMTYLLPIPAEAKKYPGKAMLTLSGYSKINGTQVDKATNTVTSFFRVLKSNYRLLTDSSVTPTLAQQLHSEVNSLGERIEETETDVADIRADMADIEDKLDNINVEETDPTVPDWAKQPNKPSYTADEVGAADYNWVSVIGEIVGRHEEEIKENEAKFSLEISALIAKLNAVANSDDVDLDQLAEIVAYIKSNKTLIEAITTSKVSVSDIVDNLLTDVSNKPLSARMGLELKRMIDKIQVPDSNIPEWALQPEKPSYSASEVGADEKGTAAEKVGEHNLSDEAHNDIRLLISGLTDRLNVLANSSDTDLDQLAEIVAYIKANKNLIDSITTNKVSVSDIIDNLTTNVSNKPLSAKMGAELKKLIDAIKIPDSLPASDVYDWAKQKSKPLYDKSEVGLGNVDNVRQYSQDNPPPYPVTSVNGQGGAVSLDASDVGAMPAGTKIPEKTSDITNDSGFITKAVNDLVNYYTKSQTFTRDEINAKISAIPKFAIEVVSSLPTSNISATTVYLVGGGSGNDLYTEYIYANGKWEILGAQTVDLTGYATETWVNTQLGDYLKQSELDAAINSALAAAKASGEFKGDKGDKGDQGERGLQGEQGVQGIQGVPGDKGDKGDTGAQGIQGVQGEKGEKGDKGDTGAQGLQGVQGIQGEKGEKGEKGETGAKGEKGDPFSIAKIYPSVAAMNAGYASDGVVKGAFVVIDTGNVNDEENARLYIKGETAYTFLTDLSGAQGIKGDKGDKGDQGEKGETGAKGDQGIQGIQGIQGEKGDKGDKGDKGEQGIQGIQGEKGDKGDTGAKGDQGIQGIQGVKGDTGAAGKTPVKGTDYFTPADKTEMVNAVINALPKYNGEVVAV